MDAGTEAADIYERALASKRRLIRGDTGGGTIPVSVRFTEELREAVMELAADAGVPPSTFVRNLVFDRVAEELGKRDRLTPASR